MPRDNGCCGASFGEHEVTAIGLMTLSMPLLIIFLPLLIFLKCISFVAPAVGRWERWTRTVIKANVHLIRTASFFSKERCYISGKLFPFSSSISGFTYRYFNFFILMLFYALVILVYNGILFLCGKV